MHLMRLFSGKVGVMKKISLVLSIFALVVLALSADPLPGLCRPTKGETTMGQHDGLEVATLAGGCFWCMQAVFEQLNGVRSVECGYSGGTVANPTYEQVCTGTTGHAESVQITFDPKVISYAELLKVFFMVHNPTTLDRQGNDVGTQYRSVIFYRSEAQRRAAEQAIKEAGRSWKAPIVTQLVAFKHFYPAAAYHQHYYDQHPNQPYCSLVIAPKVKKFRKEFKDRLRK